MSKYAGELCRPIESSGECDVCNGKATICKHILRAFDPSLHDELMWRHAGGFLKRANEMEPTQFDEAGKIRNRDFVFEVLVNVS